MPTSLPLQPELLATSTEPTTLPVTCLGQTFASDDERRAYFSARLREHLQDPGFRATEGFPIGSDEDILALSDPPYYTACPNPFLPAIIAQWSVGRFDTAPYQREPFAADVSEGKNDPIYNAHSYHTKVPHKAIMRYILHYTNPGDIVFDGFCGSGMTGVAAQLCGDRKAVQELGYTVDDAGAIYDGGQRISRLGTRRAVLNDLSPAATFIAYNYNTPVDVVAFEREAKRILNEVEAKLGWMYETWHPHCDDPKRVKARINFTVWSEVFECPNCGSEIVFSKAAVDDNSFHVRDRFPCPQCGMETTKNDLELIFEVIQEVSGDSQRRVPKRVPVLINYKIGTTIFQKPPDTFDLDTLRKVNSLSFPQAVPIDELPPMQMARVGRMQSTATKCIHHFFLIRPAHSLASLWEKAHAVDDYRCRAFLTFLVEQSIWGLSVLNRYSPTHYSQVNRYLSGVYYVASQISEVSPWYILNGKLDRLLSVLRKLNTNPHSSVIEAKSATASLLPTESVDYIFTDPPFGENIYYADLNYLIESWHKVKTDSNPEAIIDRVKIKGIREYQSLMRTVFADYFRVLKPSHWMTVEFHNSHDSVWRAIQEALSAAGFVASDVRTLDKQSSSFRQVVSDVAKQDLIISAYKPDIEFQKNFSIVGGTEEGVWIFVSQHLCQLPVVVRRLLSLETIAERQNYLLFDRMVAYHIQHGVAVPMGVAQFYAGLKQRFVERDGMYFLPDQVPEYDRARMEADTVAQIALFVSDEKSTLTWLRVQLGATPQTFQEIQPRFLQELHQARHEELPDLRVLLEENFLQDEAGHWYVPDPHRAEDLEKLRLRGLLREFETYKEGRKKLTIFRSEAMRAGFSQAWRDKEYQTIVQVAERLPETVLHEDPDLLMYYDNASLHT